MAQSETVGQRRPGAEPLHGRANPEFVLAISVYINEVGRDEGGNPYGDLEFAWAPMLHMSPNLPPAKNLHPSGFMVWSALHALADTLAQYDDETAEAIRKIVMISAQEKARKKLITAFDAVKNSSPAERAFLMSVFKNIDRWEIPSEGAARNAGKGIIKP